MTKSRYYYQYSPERLATCVLTVHAVLHIADSIELLGPVWAYWAFPMERFCGRAQRHVTSRRYPYASIDTHVVAEARLAHLGLNYGITQILTLKPLPKGTVRGQYASPLCEYIYDTSIGKVLTLRGTRSYLCPSAAPSAVDEHDRPTATASDRGLLTDALWG